jgi:RNA polymerase sigma-70 factor (ECF subfamily)
VGLESSVAGSDASVISLSAARPELFATIFERHFTAIHAYLARRVGRGGADDLAASTFTVAFERRRAFRGDADSARPWLFGIATNLLRNERRAETRSLDALSRVGRGDVTEAPGIGGIDPRLAAMLAELDPDQRDVLLLYAWGELSYEEIASSLGIAIGTVRSRLARARGQLKRGLSESEDHQTEAWEASG